VVDPTAAVSGAPVDLYGHSHGGIVAFGAATLTSKVGKLVLYEGWPVPDPEVYALPPEPSRPPGSRVAAIGRRRRRHRPKGGQARR
jgi:pimeloyl-ACP methyl ester carboxylesterase